MKTTYRPRRSASQRVWRADPAQSLTGDLPPPGAEPRGAWLWWLLAIAVGAGVAAMCASQPVEPAGQTQQVERS